jgi:N-glycosylase/DNA lyase
LEVDRSHLSLRATLDCGQAFRWREGADGWWEGVVAGRAIRLREADGACLFQVCPAPPDGGDLLRRYLRLDADLPAIAADLAERDLGIRPALAAFPGLRLLAQEPEECLLSYLCSSANSVPRIVRSIDQLSRWHGRLVACLDGMEYHAFPSPEALAAAPESSFRAAGLGYRGRAIQAVAALLLEKPGDWLAGLSRLPYAEAKAELMALPGVGPKIADCVCLFGLQHDEAVPVDTHVWALARELFAEEIAAGRLPSTLTPAAYERVRLLYRARYGPLAGWAQQYLYHWRRMGYPAGSR